MLKKMVITVLVAAVVAMGMVGLSFSALRSEETGIREIHQQVAHAEHKKEAVEKGQATADGKKAEDAGNTICPVSGEKIDETTKLTYEYKGKVYAFCCQDCLDEFKKDPEKYIERMEKGGVEGGQEQSTHKEHRSH